MEIRPTQAAAPATPIGQDYGRTARPLLRPVLQPVRPGRYLSDLVMVAGLAAIFVLAMSAAGRVITILADSRLKPPGLATGLIGLYRTYENCYGWALIWAVPLAAPLALSQASPRWRRRWFTAGYILVGLLIVLLLLGLFLPLTSLLQAMSDSPSGAK